MSPVEQQSALNPELAELDANADAAPSGVAEGAALLQTVGRVLEASERGWLVLVGGRRREARRARSCLIEPRAADLVVVAEAGAHGSAWILAVLDRPGDDATLAFAGDVTLKSAGEVTIASAKGTQLYSSAAVEVAAEELKLTATSLEASVEQASWIGRALVSRLDAIKTVATVVDRIATRVSERAQRVYRTTEEAEYIKVGSLDIQAQETIGTHSKNTVMTSENLVKINGEQIQLG